MIITPKASNLKFRQIVDSTLYPAPATISSVAGDSVAGDSVAGGALAGDALVGDSLVPAAPSSGVP